MPISLRLQAEAVELAYVNQAGHANNLARLVGQRKRPQTELDMARMSLPSLEAAVKTMRFIERHEAKVRSLLAEQDGPQ